MSHALRSSSARAHGQVGACRQAVLVRSGRGASTSYEAVCNVASGLPTQAGASWSSATTFSARRGSTRVHAAEATTGQQEANAMSSTESVAVGGFRLEGACDDATVRELIAAREARSWLFLESEGSAGPREVVEEEGVEYQELAVATPEHGTEEAAKELVEKLRLMPRPTVRLSEPSAVVALARALSIDGFLGNAEMSAWVMSKGLGGQLRVLQLRDGNTATFTYLVYDQLTRAAAIIDPVQDQLNRDTRIISELDLDLKYIVNTHCHDDHISSGTKLKVAFPGATTAISEASGARADRKLQHQDRLALGRHDLTVLTTPGHTDGCICLHTTSNGGVVFTGDALHVRSCGHTYNMQDRCEALFDSIHRELFSLPPQTVVYPGHGEDECPTSTVGEEMQHSSRIHLGVSREEFVEAMLRTAAPPSLPKGTLRRVVSANMLDGIDEDELVSAWLRPASSWPFSSVDA